MKLGLMLGYWMMGPEDPIDLVLEAERLGFDSVWTAEAYGSDCISYLSWMGARTTRIKLGTAVMQIAARTPACAAMTATTIDHLSGGRLILGIGVSGPQVVEGWYGQPFPRPMGRTREWIDLFRAMVARHEPVTFDGEHYKLPYPGGAGLGKPLKLITRPLRDRIPVYMGAEGPKNVALAVEKADGWLPLFCSPETFQLDLYRDTLAKRRDHFEIAATINVIIDDDVRQALLPTKWMLGFYLGGMGAKKENFHLNLIERMGFGEAAHQVQDLFFAGRRDEAIAAVPDDLADAISLSGPPARIRERLAMWRNGTPVTTLIAATRDPKVLQVLAEANADGDSA
jgi:F420-dependent oxidoreductase-like protein